MTFHRGFLSCQAECIFSQCVLAKSSINDFTFSRSTLSLCEILQQAQRRAQFACLPEKIQWKTEEEQVEVSWR